ncbi:hypothetical protein OGAPHI_003930 [Ogataea philodendri]|uniref:GIY-YIG domain-containing protein n=1 Tax=Ogataea philodendri TaxID=1378263 RepID=A0A9P8P6C6_9ASCO|nr:uncharacterized protein OGAPHI_003930 [Ogataea philodendri]KAH3665742.1 hypothetical protein OGAPHI_003930 [Ogataea philodendri]
MSHNLQVPPPFYCVYLLRSVSKPNSYYIGSTPNPYRRLRQHNGELSVGGAYRTKKTGFRPWQMTMVVYGFPSKIAALQFEHAWQHFYQTRHIPLEKRLGSKSSSTVHLRIANVKLLLAAAGFVRMGLRVAIFQKHIYDIWVTNKYNVAVPESVLLTLDFQQNQDKLIEGGNYDQIKVFVETLAAEEDKVFEKSVEKLENNDLRQCSICNQVVDPVDHAPCFCVNDSCQALYHAECWANDMLKDSESPADSTSPMIPIKGRCVECTKLNWWWPTVKNSMRVYQHSNQAIK